MVQPVVTRTQRRIERKQLVLVVLLILAVAGVSFCLGILLGRQQGRLEAIVAEEASGLPTVAQVKAPPMPADQASAVVQERLTFYDNLPKGKQAPLGSGINLPPEPAVVAASPREQQVKPPSPTVKTAPAPAAPPSTPAGDFVVQVASYKSGEEAKKLATRLASYGLATFVEKADLGAKGVWYRVLAGPFASRENAEQASGLLREKERLSALVRQR